MGMGLCSDNSLISDSPDDYESEPKKRVTFMPNPSNDRFDIGTSSEKEYQQAAYELA